MNANWIVGILISIAVFAVLEAYAFKHPERSNTLSRFVYDLGSKWPLSIWIMGVFAGVLAAHFFWHWCPPGSLSTGWNLLDMQDGRNALSPYIMRHYGG